MWQKFRKREELIKIYKDKGEPALDHLPRTAVDGVISWEPVSMHWNIIVSSSGNDAMLSVTARMSRRERSCKHVFVPPHPPPPLPSPPLPSSPLLSSPLLPHPTASGDDAMWSVAANVSKEGTQLPGRYCPTPPHPTQPHPPRIWRRCHVERGRKCVKGRNAAARTLLSHPTRIRRRCHVECGSTHVDEGTQLQGRYCPTPSPPHPTPGCYCPTPPNPTPPASGDDVAARMSTRERSCKDVIVPPHLHPETMPRWVWQHVCRRGNAAARTLLSHPQPTPPHSRTLLSHPTQPHPPRIWRRCGSTYVDEGTQLQGRYCPTPPASGDDATLSVAARMSTRERSCKDVIVPPPAHPRPCSCVPSSTYVLPHSTWHRLRMQVGWDNNVLAAAFPRRHTCCHIVSRCGGGGVGWGGTITSWSGVGWAGGGTITSLQLRSLVDIRAATLNVASSPDAGGVGQ